MDPALQSLIDRLNRLSEQFEELREGVRKALDGATVDPEMALIRSRKVLEYVVRDVFVRRVQEPPGSRPLENLIQRLVKDGHFPPAWKPTRRPSASWATSGRITSASESRRPTCTSRSPS
jgi:hypothetical protein